MVRRGKSPRRVDLSLAVPRPQTPCLILMLVYTTLLLHMTAWLHYRITPLSACNAALPAADGPGRLEKKRKEKAAVAKFSSKAETGQSSRPLPRHSAISNQWLQGHPFADWACS